MFTCTTNHLQHLKDDSTRTKGTDDAVHLSLKRLTLRLNRRVAVLFSVVPTSLSNNTHNLSNVLHLEEGVKKGKKGKEKGKKKVQKLKHP